MDWRNRVFEPLGRLFAAIESFPKTNGTASAVPLPLLSRQPCSIPVRLLRR